MQPSQKIVLLDQLGDGLTSTVSKCKFGNEIYAIKVFKDTCSLKSRVREVSALTNLKDCNVVRMTIYDPSYNWLVFELLFQKDLFDFVANEKKSFSEPVAKYMFRSLATVVSQMHNKGFAHRDLKLENILMDTETLEPRISDLGFAEPFTTQQFVTRSMGTSGYMAPELQAQGIDGRPLPDKIEAETLPSSDVFALGVCLFILTFAHPPFQSTKKSDACPYWRCIVAGKWDTFWKACERHKPARSKELKQLLQAMLHPNPKNRPSMNQILECDWLKEGIQSQEFYYMEMFSRKQGFTN